eukprot:PhM_4_TR7331/c0_g1_i1/m.88828
MVSASEYLRESRLPHHIPHDARKIFTLGVDALQNNRVSSEERPLVLEQVIFAALECSKPEVALWCVQQLQAMFGKESTRVLRLHGLICEATGRTDEARQVYHAVIAANTKANNITNATTAFAVKRLSAMAKANGNYDEAISILEHTKLLDNKTRTVLELFPKDDSLYSELSTLSALSGRHEKALFYVDELLLRDPYSYARHVRAGDLAYTASQFARARKHYCLAVTLNPTGKNVFRTLCCLWLTCVKMGGEEGSKNGAVRKQAAEKLKKFVDSVKLQPKMKAAVLKMVE